MKIKLETPRGGSTNSIIVYRRNKNGDIKTYASIKDAAADNNISAWTIRQLYRNGHLLNGQYHFSDNKADWSHCNNEPTCSRNRGGLRQVQDYKLDIDAKIKQLFTQRAQHVEMPEPVQQPQTQEDWEAMKQRAMQPFVCSLTDEGMRKHEEEVRKRSLAAMREKSYDNCTLERATRTNIYSEV